MAWFKTSVSAPHPPKFTPRWAKPAENHEKIVKKWREMALFREPKTPFCRALAEVAGAQAIHFMGFMSVEPGGRSQPQGENRLCAAIFASSGHKATTVGCQMGADPPEMPAPGHCSVGSPLLKQEVPPADHDGCGSQVAIRLSQGFRARGAANEQPERFSGSVSDNLPRPIMKGRWKARKKASRKWPLLAGFGRFFEGLHYQFIVLGGDVAGAQEGDLPGLMSIESNCLQPSSGPREPACAATFQAAAQTDECGIARI